MKRFNLHFEVLPGYAAFLLNEKLDIYTREQLRIAREMEFPLLKFFEHMGEEQLLELSKQSLTVIFQYLINNQADLQIIESLEQWRNNMLPLIDKEQIVADDISLTGLLRKKAFSQFLPEYTSDVNLAIKILIELDTFNTAAELESYRLFLNIQRDKLEHGYNELAASDKLYKQSQSLTHIGNWTWMATTGKITWSDELYRIYGLEPQSEELTFERFLGLIHPEDRDTRVAQIEESMRTAKAKDYTMRIVTDNGITKVLQGKNEVLLDETGKAIGIAGTCQDITTEFYLREQLEREKLSLDNANRTLEKKNVELERSNKELTSFSYIASHDLQEPLRKIKTFNSIIQQQADSLPEDTRNILYKIDNSVSRMQTLIRDLLAFSRIHNDSPQTEAVDLNSLMADVAASFTDSPSDTKLNITIAKLPHISGLSFQLNQLFTNIISNSVKYAKGNAVNVLVNCQTVSGKDISLPDIDRAKSYYQISIADNGIGFSPEYKEKIFEIFQRLHTKNEYSGTGIGLAICKKIVQNHNGAISASSEPGQGATFNVYLPAQQDTLAT